MSWSSSFVLSQAVAALFSMVQSLRGLWEMAGYIYILGNIHVKCFFPLFLPLSLPIPVFCWDCTDNSGINCKARRCLSMEEPLKCRGIFELLFPSVCQRFLEVRLTDQSVSEIISSLLTNDVRCRTDAIHSFKLYFPYISILPISEG